MNQHDLHDRTGERCARIITGAGPTTACEHRLMPIESPDVFPPTARWVCGGGHLWTDTMERVRDGLGLTDPMPARVMPTWSEMRGVVRGDVTRRLAPLDTWPRVAVTVLPIPWTWRLRPLVCGMRWGMLHLAWGPIEITLTAQDRPCDWFHEMYAPDGDLWHP
jgi:hypothetical protein